MHRSIRDHLEYLLANRGLAARNRDVSAHLAECRECSMELSSMQAQTELFSTLRISEELDPAPGFYARVLQRIEERVQETMWGAFLVSPFAKRLTYASLALALMFGAYVVTQETHTGRLSRGPTVLAQNAHYDPPVIGSESEQRDAVLENFATHEGLPR